MEGLHWKDRAIASAEVISDAFDIAKAYGAHLANWVLWFCLLANLVEMVNTDFETFAGPTIVAIQSISLDVAGFGLTAMASSAERRGDEKSASKANGMGWTLITIMALTVGLITLSLLVPPWASTIEKINKGLMFVRVVVTVFYGHIVHQLRSVKTVHENRMKELERNLGALQKQLGDQEAAYKRELGAAQGQQANNQHSLNQLRASYEERIAQLESLHRAQSQETQQMLTQQEQTYREERNRLMVSHAAKIQELQSKLNEQRTAPAQEKLKEVPRPKPQKPQEEEECIEGLFEYGKSVYQWNGETYYTKAEAATRWGLSPRQVETFTASHPEYALPLKERGDLKPRARLIRADALEKTKQAS